MKKTGKQCCQKCGNFGRGDLFCHWLQSFINSAVASTLSECDGFLARSQVPTQNLHSRPENPSENSLDRNHRCQEGSPTACPETDYSTLEHERQHILQVIEIKGLKGSIVWEKVCCSKRNCRCSRGYLHGPFAYLHFYQAGKVRRRYLGKGLPALMSKPREELEARLGQIDKILGQDKEVADQA